MKYTQEVIKDIKQIDKDRENDFELYVDIVSVLEALEEFEINVPPTMDAEDLLHFIMDTAGIDEYYHWDNSYNWGSRLSHDIDFRVLPIGERSLYLVKVHRFGDIRGNYSDYILYSLPYEEHFWEILMEVGSESSSIMGYKDKEYYIEPDPLSEYVFVRSENEDYEVPGPYDIDDIKRWLDENL